ncbi:hypothetical protein [Syntrophomonas curvata]
MEVAGVSGEEMRALRDFDYCFATHIGPYDDFEREGVSGPSF